MQEWYHRAGGRMTGVGIRRPDVGEASRGTCGVRADWAPALHTLQKRGPPPPGRPYILI